MWSVFGSPEFLKSYFDVYGYYPFVFIATKTVTRGLNHYVYFHHIRIIFPLNHHDTNYSILVHIIMGNIPIWHYLLLYSGNIPLY